MTREEAIKSFEEENGIKKYIASLNKNHPAYQGYLELIERNEMAISALSEELSEDGTLTVHVSDGSKAKRVLVMGDNIFGGLYYPDSAGNKGHWGRRIVDNGFNADWVCSECGHREYTDFIHMNFCPNCGADMRGVSE